MIYEHLDKHPAISRVEVAYDDGLDEIVYLDNAGNALEVEDENLDTAVEIFVCEELPEGWDTGTVVIDVASKQAHFMGRIAMIYEHLDKHPAVSRIEVTYDGCDDSGQVGEIIYLDKAGNALEIKDEALAAAIEEFVYAHLPGGWEINAGSFGTVVIDVPTKKARFEHNERYELYETIEFDIE